jgi:acyl-CoA synthetase (AMP-forming)/AMP-acid ligase II
MPDYTAVDNGLPKLADLPAYVRHYADLSPGHLAMSIEGQHLTYSTVRERLARYSAALRRLGLGKGSAIAVFGNSRPECFLLFLACCETGTVFLGLNPKHTSGELLKLCADADPGALFVMTGNHDENQAAKVRELSAAIPSIRHLILRSPASITDVEGTGLDDLTAEPGADPGPAPDPGAPCALIYTSGSTGLPKGALLSQAGLIRSAMLTWDHWYGRLRGIRTVAQHPISHVTWLTLECLTTMIAGGTLYFRERFDGPGTLELIERERVNLWFTFPSMADLAMKSDNFVTTDISSLRQVAFGSSPSLEILRALRSRTEAVLSTSYGLTEASGGAITATAQTDSLDLVASSLGRVVPGVRARVADPEGREAPLGEPGELLISDTCVFTGYLNRAADTGAALDEDGWLHTGDIVTRDSSGILRLIGRMREMFKSGGYNVYPAEIEQVLCDYPGVLAAAVVDVPDPLWGQIGVGFIAAPDAPVPDPARLDAFVRQRLANYKIPKRFEFRARLPHLENGKVNKKALREEAIRGMTVTATAKREAP